MLLQGPLVPQVWMPGPASPTPGYIYLYETAVHRAGVRRELARERGVETD